MSTKHYTKTRFSADDTALVLIDHQSGIMQMAHDYSPAEFRNNVMALAKLGKVFNLPTVLSTSLGQGPNGPFIPQVVSLVPDVPVIDRPGIIDAWDDPKFVTAVEKTSRKNLIMAGVTIDVCLAFAAPIRDVRVNETLSIFARIFVRIDGALQDFASDVHRYVPGPALRGVEGKHLQGVAVLAGPMMPPMSTSVSEILMDTIGEADLARAGKAVASILRLGPSTMTEPLQ